MNNCMLNIFNATLQVLPFDRSRTYPLRDSKNLGQNVKHGEPLDPEELYRRLERYKEGQARALERRQARTDKASSPQGYHHIPQVAATDFVSTTTTEFPDSRSIHPLSRSVVREFKRAQISHNAGLREIPVFQFVEDQDAALQKMLATAERNQFQQSGALRAAAACVDKIRNSNKPKQRDFEPHRLSRNAISRNARQPSLSFVDNGARTASNPADVCPHLTHTIRNPGDRHDWAQKDQLV